MMTAEDIKKNLDDLDIFTRQGLVDAGIAVGMHLIVQTLQGENGRLQAILDAETGKKGLPGWLFSRETQGAWIADHGRGPGFVERVKAGEWRWSVWQSSETDGPPDKSWTFVPTALEGMEAAMATGRAVRVRTSPAM